MFGMVPGIFNEEEAATKVADGYEMEELEKWVVMKKVPENMFTVFRPCRVSDIKQAEEDGWKIVNHKK